MFNLTSRWQGHLKGGWGGGLYRAKDTDEATILPGGLSQPTALVHLTASLLHDRSRQCSCKHREKDENRNRKEQSTTVIKFGNNSGLFCMWPHVKCYL